MESISKAPPMGVRVACMAMLPGPRRMVRLEKKMGVNWVRVK